MSFSRKYRLVSKHDFQSVFSNPYKVTLKPLLALYRPNQQPNARLGVIIGKNVIKLAVDRNRLRRVIRESFRHRKEALGGLDIIVMVRSAPLDRRNKPVFRETVERLWPLLKTPSPT